MPVFSKVKAVGIGGGLAGLIMTIIVAILSANGVELSPEMVALITSGLTALVAFLSGYIRREVIAFK